MLITIKSYPQRDNDHDADDTEHKIPDPEQNNESNILSSLLVLIL